MVPQTCKAVNVYSDALKAKQVKRSQGLKVEMTKVEILDVLSNAECK